MQKGRVFFSPFFFILCFLQNQHHFVPQSNPVQVEQNNQGFEHATPFFSPPLPPLFLFSCSLQSHFSSKRMMRTNGDSQPAVLSSVRACTVLLSYNGTYAPFLSFGLLGVVSPLSPQIQTDTHRLQSKGFYFCHNRSVCDLHATFFLRLRFKDAW